MEKTTDKSGPNSENVRMARALFEKAVHNAEMIGQIKTLPFSMREVEKCRALYKENEKIWEQVQQQLKG